MPKRGSSFGRQLRVLHAQQARKRQRETSDSSSSDEEELPQQIMDLNNFPQNETRMDMAERQALIDIRHQNIIDFGYDQHISGVPSVPMTAT